MASEAEALLSIAGRVATLVLNRPKVLNSINLPAVRALAEHVRTLAAAKADLAAFVMKGAGGRAFCAGGDVKWVAEATVTGRLPEARAFFREEYMLDHALAALNASGLPQVSLWDGVVMGGGVGISIHSSYRIATEKSVFAMPETTIGFIPDVGGSHFLPRLPDAVGGAALGLYLALTSARLTGSALVHAGIATHFVRSAQLPVLEGRLALCGSPADVEAAVAASTEDPGPNTALPPADVEDIRALFSGAESVTAIAEACAAAAARGSAVGSATVASLAKTSPTSQALTLELLRRGGGSSLKECYAMEHRVAHRLLALGREGDFYEGVRALLIAKDNAPAWRPASVREVSPAAVAAMFERLPESEELKL